MCNHRTVLTPGSQQVSSACVTMCSMLTWAVWPLLIFTKRFRGRWKRWQVHELTSWGCHCFPYLTQTKHEERAVFTCILYNTMKPFVRCPAVTLRGGFAPGWAAHWYTEISEVFALDATTIPISSLPVTIVYKLASGLLQRLGFLGNL